MDLAAAAGVAEDAPGNAEDVAAAALATVAAAPAAAAVPAIAKWPALHTPPPSVAPVEVYAGALVAGPLVPTVGDTGRVAVVKK